jgi:hypothetical protein
MLAGNHELLSRVNSDYIDVYLKMVRNAHTVDDLVQDFHLLCSLCVHDDEPILETQELIKHAIFANVAAPAEQQLLPCTRVDKGRIIIWGRTPDKGKPFKQWSGRLASKLASTTARLKVVSVGGFTWMTT